MQNSPILIGVAIDLSGSMEQSIRNNIDEKMSRLKSMRQSLEQFAKDARQTIQENRQEDNEIVVRVFAYGFGFRLIDKREVCDLLSLLEAKHGFSCQEETSREPIYQQTTSHSNGYSILSKTLSDYGYDYELITKLVSFVEKHFTMSDAGKLAQELRKDRSSASRLASLIPKTNFEAGKKWVFTKSVNYALGQQVIHDDFEEAKRLAFALVARADHSTVEVTRDRIIEYNQKQVMERLDKIGDTTLPIEEIADLWEREQVGDADVEKAKEWIYGGTPMQQTFEIIAQRFRRERSKLASDTRPFLFVLSDGQPTDGNPLMIARSLKDSGVTIISCFVTDDDITEPRILFNDIVPNWTEGAKLMFNMASLEQEGSQMVQFLKEGKWNILPNAKLFVQVNHSEILEEFLQGLLNIM